jgi:hypothetical protein
MPFRSMEQGIEAIKAGNTVEGARLLRIALKGEQLTGSLRAVAYLWLAETNADTQHKRACYNEALRADPNNQDAKNRLSALLVADLPPSPPPAPPTLPQVQPQPMTQTQQFAALQPQPPTLPANPDPVMSMGYTPTAPMNPMASVLPTNPNPTYTPQPVEPSAPYRIVGIIGGPNGLGTGFFVNRTGLLATTRYVTGGRETLTIELETGKQLEGRVSRSFPELDLALIQIEGLSSDMLPVTPFPQISDEAPLTALTHSGKIMRGKQRPTKRMLAAYWFPTSFNKLSDAGGNPVFDDRHYLVGMLTKNASRSSEHLFGLHIAAIRRSVEHYAQEMQTGERRVYCPNCGYVSRAVGMGGYYCEGCGSTTPQAVSLTRYYTPQTMVFYEENSRVRCTHCGSTSGFYDGKCLRCGNVPKVQG